jgi:hypothetical protein
MDTRMEASIVLLEPGYDTRPARPEPDQDHGFPPSAQAQLGKGIGHAVPAHRAWGEAQVRPK